MNRLVPHPILTLALIVMWLLLTAFSIGHFLLGTAVALIAGQAMASLEPAGIHLRRWHRIPRFLAIVIADVIRSNVAVAWLVLTGGRRGKRVSGFVEIRLELSDRTALTLLAIVITATPGTAWLEYDPKRRLVLLHVFDLVDAADWRDLVNTRYEPLLLEIFE